MHTTFYRIQNLSGVGFYNGDVTSLLCHDEMLVLHDKHCDDFKSIMYVIDEFTPHVHFCGFVSIDVITTYFSEIDIYALLLSGFNIYKITADGVLFGDDNLQVAYDKTAIVSQEIINDEILKLYEVKN